MCPICMSLVASNETELVSHLVAGHPREAYGLGAALGIANLALVKQPTRLLLIDCAVLGIAVILARTNRRGWT
jgi:hypothetical protein